MDNHFPLYSDVPVEDLDRDKDRLGFGETARQLADVFLRNNLSRGLVVGIEGVWGSGKSSLANLALRTLEKEREQHKLRIVRFSPWIVGNREQLLGQLFIELDSALYELLPTDLREQIHTALKRYAQGAALIAPPLKFAGDVGVPMAGWIGRIFDSVAKSTDQFCSPSLSKLHAELRHKLAGHNGKIIVFIDDLDRLEPQETVEILRLIRAVADFPNVAYLLAYDPFVLARGLESALGVKDGNTYIEKIVQASFPVPKPMAFDLRSWLADEARAIFDRTDLTSEADERLERALSFWCSEYISTPRDVIRASNALKLHVAPLADQLDPADGLFIQMMRIHHPELHEWVQRYLMKKVGSDPNDRYLAMNDAAEDSDSEQESKLATIIGRQGSTLRQFLNELRQHLPQVSVPDCPPLLTFGADERHQFATERRLYGPSYFRLYFTSSLPSGFLSDQEVSAFLDMCARDREAAVHQFRERCAEGRPQGDNMAQVLLFRMLERKGDISADLIPDLFAVLGDGMDDFAHRLPERPGSPPHLYGDAIEIFRLFSRLDNERRMDALVELFVTARSLAWLSSILGDAIQEHGFANFEGKPEEQRLLTEEEFEYIRQNFLQRLRQADAADLKKTPYFCSIIHVWRWAGGGREAREWISIHTRSSVDFVEVLSLMLSCKGPSHGRELECYLDEHILRRFFESPHAVVKRLSEIASDAGQAEETRVRANKLLTYIEPPDESVLKYIREMQRNTDNQSIP